MLAVLKSLKESGQDFEFYPTTDEIIAAMLRDLGVRGGEEDRYRKRNGASSVLDIGAGNGKVLRALKERGKFSELYAIEKSPILCQQLDADVFIVGTEFEEQSLLEKQVDMIFCNPPYSQFVDWAVKIIRQSAAPLVYLVIPSRWKDSVHISDAMKFRDAKFRTVGKFSFEDAEDRQARAEVNLIRIDLSDEKEDAFDRFFDEQFADLKAKFKGEKKREIDDPMEDNPKFASLVVGENYPVRLVELYNQEIDNIQRNYQLVGQLDVDLLKEFDVTPDRILKCLKARRIGLRNLYWQELFSHMSQVTDRLTAKKRKMMLGKLQANGHVDFTVSNIHAVIIWVLKNANNYLDEQLIETFWTMAEKANVRNYKSNLKAFVHDRWRYEQEKPSHFALEYRLVLQHVGGIRRGYSFERGLEERGAEFIGDLLTVANNLGFLCHTADRRLYHTARDSWTSGQLEIFYCMVKNERQPLIEARAFLNGNMHIRLNQKFALALNVEMGRLKGWIHSGEDAAEELGDKSAGQYFGKNLQLGQSSLTMLGAPADPVQEPAVQEELFPTGT